MTATLHRYPAYKPSGVDWLGDMPGHWDVRRTKTLLRERSEKGRPSEALLAATQTKGVVRKEQYENRTVLALKDLHLLKLVKIGDFVISLRSFQGGIEYAREQGIISPAYTILYPVDSSLHDYLALLFKSKPYLENLTLHVTGIRQGQNIDYSELSRSYLPLPPLPEQRAIAYYLDHVDRRMQLYVTAKRKLIALLEEEKQAIINRAVTRGLDPNVRLKPSGVEWLGDVPQHWEVRRVKSLSLVKRGASPRPIADPIYFEDDGEYAWVRIVDVTASSHYLERTTQRLSRRGQSLSVELQPGALFLSIAGSVGKPIITKVKCCIHDGFVYFPQFRGNAEFLYRVFSCGAPFARLGKLGTQLNLNTETVGSICLGWPPFPEQAAIVEYLDKATADIVAAIARARRQMELVQEYRTRLIADVVTGKLDVREAAAQLPDEADDQDPIGETAPLVDGLPGDLYDIDESVEDSVMEEEVTA